MPLQTTTGERRPEAARTTAPSPAQLTQKTNHARQAGARAQLGKELLDAAQAYSVRQTAAVEALRKEQTALREDIEQEVARTLRGYDQSLGNLEERLLGRMEAVEKSVQTLSSQWHEAHGLMTQMVRRAEALLDQSRVMLEGARAQTAAPSRSGAQHPTRAAGPRTKPDNAAPKRAPAPTVRPPAASKSAVDASANRAPAPDPVEGDVRDADAPPPLIYTRAIELLRGATRQGAPKQAGVR